MIWSVSLTLLLSSLFAWLYWQRLFLRTASFQRQPLLQLQQPLSLHLLSYVAWSKISDYSSRSNVWCGCWFKLIKFSKLLQQSQWHWAAFRAHWEESSPGPLHAALHNILNDLWCLECLEQRDRWRWREREAGTEVTLQVQGLPLPFCKNRNVETDALQYQYGSSKFLPFLRCVSHYLLLGCLMKGILLSI